MGKLLKIFLFIIATSVSVAVAQTSQYSGAVGFGAQKAWDNPNQNMGEGQSRPGYAKYTWESDLIIPLRLREGILTVINLPPDDTILDSYMGDKDFFEGKPLTANSFGVAPVEGRAPADTNLIIYGAKGRKYNFYIRSETINSAKITNVIVDIVVRGAGTGGSALTPVSGARNFAGGAGSNSGVASTGGMRVNNLVFDLDIFVPDPDDFIIAPDRVWRDGDFIYLDFGPKARTMLTRPVISIIIEGMENIADTHVEGDDGRITVVETGGAGNVELILRSGQRMVCIKQTKSKPYVVDADDIQEMLALAMDGRMSEYAVNNIYAPRAAARGINVASYGVQPQTYASNFVNTNPTSSRNVNYDRAVAGGQFYIEGTNPQVARGGILPQHHVPLIKVEKNRIALEIAVDESVEKLDEYWNRIYNENRDGMLGPIFNLLTPFYSVETRGVDELGARPYHGAELYRLRLMLKDGSDFNVEVADEYCRRLGASGIKCNVVVEQ